MAIGPEAPVRTPPAFTPVQHSGHRLVTDGALIAAGGVGVVASDAHGPSRPPALSRAFRALVDGGLPAHAAETMVGSGPRRLLAEAIRPRAAIAA